MVVVEAGNLLHHVKRREIFQERKCPGSMFGEYVQAEMSGSLTTTTLTLILTIILNPIGGSV